VLNGYFYFSNEINLMVGLQMKEMSDDAKKVLIDQIKKRSESYGYIWHISIFIGSIVVLDRITSPIFEKMSLAMHEIIAGVSVFASIGLLVFCKNISNNIEFSKKQDLCSEELGHSMVTSSNGEEFCEVCYYPQSQGLFHKIFKL
jgi:hypothetical protein